MPSAVITVNALRIHARIGVMEQEQTVGNDFEVSLSIEYPVNAGALEGDNLSGTLNYADVVALVKREMSRPAALLEHAAARIRGALLAAYPEIMRLSVTVAKLTPPIPGASMKSVAFTLAD